MQEISHTEVQLTLEFFTQVWFLMWEFFWSRADARHIREPKHFLNKPRGQSCPLGEGFSAAVR